MKVAKRLMTLVGMLALVLVCTGCSNTNPNYKVAADNATNFGNLLTHLVTAYETPAETDASTIDTDLNAIKAVDGTDYQMAKSIADHWNSVYLDKSYQLHLYGGQREATEVSDVSIPNESTHAIVVLGYELKDGQMTDELRGRCDAAAALARSLPNALLVCSGGATGKNNPEKHTEAGLMKDYLANSCGIEANRIFIDENAMTTAENATNCFEIMKKSGVKTMTIVTSSYHQRWGQAVYNAVAELYRIRQGYDVKIVGDYSFDIAPEVPVYARDDRFAVMQIGEILELPADVVKSLPSFRE